MARSRSFSTSSLASTNHWEKGRSFSGIKASFDPGLKWKYGHEAGEGKQTLRDFNIIHTMLIQKSFAVGKRQSGYDVRLAA